jgi:hypothetical protein
MGTIAVVVETMSEYYISIGDTVNAKRAIVAAIMKGIRATPVKKMRNIEIKIGSAEMRGFFIEYFLGTGLQIPTGGACRFIEIINSSLF